MWQCKAVEGGGWHLHCLPEFGFAQSVEEDGGDPAGEEHYFAGDNDLWLYLSRVAVIVCAYGSPEQIACALKIWK